MSATAHSGSCCFAGPTLSFTPDGKLRIAPRREGGYLLLSNIVGDEPGHLWWLYLLLPEIEQAFKELKNGLSICHIRHQLEGSPVIILVEIPLAILFSLTRALRQTVVQYHSSVVGHGFLISDLEARVRRVERHLELPPLVDG